MMRRFSIHKLVLGATVVLFATGHGEGGCCADEPILGELTGTACPPSSTLTYASFGNEFMTRYCTRCHGSTLSGAARMGAPPFHDFDTQLGVQQVGDRIDRAAGAGPDAQNDQMPPSGSRPTVAERQQLAEWIACGAP